MIKSLKKKHIEKVENWLNNKQRIIVDYKDETSNILDRMLEKALPEIETAVLKTNIFNTPGIITAQV